MITSIVHCREDLTLAQCAVRGIILGDPALSVDALDLGICPERASSLHVGVLERTTSLALINLHDTFVFDVVRQSAALVVEQNVLLSVQHHVRVVDVGVGILTARPFFLALHMSIAVLSV